MTEPGGPVDPSWLARRDGPAPGNGDFCAGACDGQASPRAPSSGEPCPCLLCPRPFRGVSPTASDRMSNAGVWSCGNRGPGKWGLTNHPSSTGFLARAKERSWWPRQRWWDTRRYRHTPPSRKGRGGPPQPVAAGCGVSMRVGAGMPGRSPTPIAMSCVPAAIRRVPLPPPVIVSTQSRSEPDATAHVP